MLCWQSLEVFHCPAWQRRREKRRLSGWGGGGGGPLTWKWRIFADAVLHSAVCRGSRQNCRGSLTHSSKCALPGEMHLEGVCVMWCTVLVMGRIPGKLLGLGRKMLFFPRELPENLWACAVHSGDSTWIIFKGAFYSSHSVIHHCLKNKRKVK